MGCCDDSPNRPATKHLHATGHPIIEGCNPPEGGGWRHIGETMVEPPDRTPHPGPIPRFF
jgi:hypothetical protein